MRRSTGLSEREAPDLEITRMRRRHIRGVMAIERQVYPRPWSPSLFLSEIHAGRTRAYLVAIQDHAVIGYGGGVWDSGGAHVTTIARGPEHQSPENGGRALYE